MNCEKFKEMLANDWACTLSAEEQSAFESHAAECSACRDERASLDILWRGLSEIPSEAPSPLMSQRFYAMLEGYRQGLEKSEPKPKRNFGSGGWLSFWLRPAFQLGMGAILVVLGFMAGYWIRYTRGGLEEISDLRAEVHETRQMLAVSLLRQSSASDRLKGVSWSTQVSSPDPDFLTTLNHTLNNDPNVNVRLAAMDALAHFAGYPQVRQDLVRSLPEQDSPMVQIMLIDLLVQLHERQSVEILKRIVDDSNQNPEVRERAKWGLQRLL